jgi:hypothetical protein
MPKYSDKGTKQLLQFQTKYLKIQLKLSAN